MLTVTPAPDIIGQFLFVLDVETHEEPLVKGVQFFVFVLFEASVELPQRKYLCHNVVAILEVSKCLLVVSVLSFSLRIGRNYLFSLKLEKQTLPLRQLRPEIHFYHPQRLYNIDHIQLLVKLIESIRVHFICLVLWSMPPSFTTQAQQDTRTGIIYDRGEKVFETGAAIDVMPVLQYVRQHDVQILFGDTF